MVTQVSDIKGGSILSADGRQEAVNGEVNDS